MLALFWMSSEDLSTLYDWSILKKAILVQLTRLIFMEVLREYDQRSATDYKLPVASNHYLKEGTGPL